MARISLILPLGSAASVSTELAGEYRRALESTGHSVEIVSVNDPAASERRADPAWRTVRSEEPGLAAASFAGLRQARGEWLVILDVSRGYTVDDVQRVVRHLIEDDADLVVASRRLPEGLVTFKGRLSRGMGAVLRRVIGSSDPLAGLVALTRDLAMETAFAPVGSHFAMELLVRAEGKHCDVPALCGPGSPPPRFTLDDLRHLKRLSDQRFGTLSRLVQFCVVGASGMVVDLSCYAFFQWVFAHTVLAGMPTPIVGDSLSLSVAVAAGLAIAIALTWNFSLNRRMTFSYARQGSLGRQYVTYAFGNGLGIALSFSLRLLLPVRVPFFGRHRLAAAVVGIVAATGVSFSMARWVVFRRRAVDQVPALGEPVGFRGEASSVA